MDHHHQVYAKTGSRVRFNDKTEEIEDVELVDVTSDDQDKEYSDNTVNGSDDTDGKGAFDAVLDIKP